MASKNYIRKIVDDYCVLDTETTGFSVYYNEVIEIGILRVRNNEIVDKYETLIKPEIEIDEYITALTGISNDMVKDKPKISEINRRSLEEKQKKKKRN